MSPRSPFGPLVRECASDPGLDDGRLGAVTVDVTVQDDEVGAQTGSDPATFCGLTAGVSRTGGPEAQPIA
jgi:hypothetical protein